MSRQRLRVSVLGAACPLAVESARGIHKDLTTIRGQHYLEDAMTNAAQTLLLTAGLFGLSFFTIFAIWYADRLCFGTPRKLPS
jgi:hypothetical protein